jgi:hypothetical protein
MDSEPYQPRGRGYAQGHRSTVDTITTLDLTNKDIIGNINHITGNKTVPQTKRNRDYTGESYAHTRPEYAGRSRCRIARVREYIEKYRMETTGMTSVMIQKEMEREDFPIKGAMTRARYHKEEAEKKKAEYTETGTEGSRESDREKHKVGEDIKGTP